MRGQGVYIVRRLLRRVVMKVRSQGGAEGRGCGAGMVWGEGCIILCRWNS